MDNGPEDRFEIPDEAIAYIDEIIAENECFNLKDLAVSGKDLIEIGYLPGKEIGEMLNRVLNEVLEENLENEKEKIIEYVKMKRS